MRTEKQSEAPRNNGKKSQRPVTGQGKANSAKNATTHNLSGDHLILLSNENPQEFATHQHEYLMRFQPVDGVEYDLIQQMIVASWRRRLIHCMETDLFGTTEASAPSSLLLRYAAAAGRDFTTALRTIRDLQDHGFNRNCRSTLQSASSLTRGASPASTAEPPQESAPEFRRLDLTREKHRNTKRTRASRRDRLLSVPKGRLPSSCSRCLTRRFPLLRHPECRRYYMNQVPCCGWYILPTQRHKKGA